MPRAVVWWRLLPRLPEHLQDIILAYVRVDRCRQASKAADILSTFTTQGQHRRWKDYCTGKCHRDDPDYDALMDRDVAESESYQPPSTWCPCTSRDCSDSWDSLCPIPTMWRTREEYDRVHAWRAWWLDSVSWTPGGCWCHRHDIVLQARASGHHPPPQSLRNMRDNGCPWEL